MRPKIFQKQIIPSVLWFLLLFFTARIVDGFLHTIGAGHVGRYLGILGTACILLAFLYSLRKKKVITFGKIKPFLKFHETMAWLGSLMILIHAGIHLHALFPWIALGAMILEAASGFTGAYLQKVAITSLSESRDQMAASGMAEEAIQNSLYFDSLAVNFMKRWRSLHLTITSVFVTLTLFHIISVLWFGAK